MSNDTRQALAALVALKNMKDKVERGVTVAGDAEKRGMCSSFAEQAELLAEYKRQKPLAWAAARAALAAQPVAGAVAEPFWHAVVSESAPANNCAVRRADVADEKACALRNAGIYDATVVPLYAAPQPQAAPAPEPTSDETLTWEKPPSAIEGRLGVWLTSGAELHPRTVNLVVRFARALASKLAAAEAKYGYSDGWASPDWVDECRAKLMEHIAKGDPRDVAAYCAFLWHHGASTARPEPSAQGRPCPFGCTTQEEHDAHQSAEPSAQAVREPGDPLHDDAYVRGVAVGFVEDDSRRTTLLRIADRMQKLAASPQPEPSAQGEPVACDRDAPVCPWCDRQGLDICQHADDARTCGK